MTTHIPIGLVQIFKVVRSLSCKMVRCLLDIFIEFDSTDC
jgi:hypothetical protein